MPNAADLYKLDNPAWYALTEKHQQFAIGTGSIKKYQRSIAPWVGYNADDENILEQIDPFVEVGEGIYLFDKLPSLPSNYKLETELVCRQMVCTNKIIVHLNDTIELEENADEIGALINMVQPGYYNPGTCKMGAYYGIRQQGMLVALAGERMRMNELTEVSGVVTHPNFTGRGYAQQLVAHVTNKNLAAGNTAFLHVAATNERAIQLYERLGYVNRRFITVRKIIKMY